jgi:hypothetical protein
VSIDHQKINVIKSDDELYCDGMNNEIVDE